jgi:hypothetical protein
LEIPGNGKVKKVARKIYKKKGKLPEERQRFDLEIRQ